ncbi:hypothetical protein [Dactylosporangium sp. NPDC051541]|uniref:hypothetical protein n=1 Tax=Dactylosporangium sp. NPDC051541 TaxID=3363977 RepID=UPI0037A39C52
MPDTAVEDEFARFEAAYSGTFRPVPVEAMPRWRRHRRRGALWLGGLAAAVAAALSVNALQPGAGGERPLWTDRVVHLDGARGDLQVRFADRQHGWAVASDCGTDNVCANVVGRSTDGGRTWTRVDVAGLPDRGRPVLAVRGPDSIVFGVTSPVEDLWESTDGARTFHRPTGDVEGIFLTLPPDTLTGAGHTAWRVVREGLDTYASYSADGGTTWSVLRPALGTGATLRLSPDGRDAWAFAGNPTRVWRLRPDGAYEEPNFPITATPGAIGTLDNGGLLTMVPGRGQGIWRDGQFTLLPEPLRDAELAVALPDGAISVALHGSLIVGGEDGGWVRYVTS